MCETRVALHCCRFCWVHFLRSPSFCFYWFLCVFFFSSVVYHPEPTEKSVVVYLFHTKRFSLFSLFYAWPTLPEIRQANPMCEEGWQQRFPLGHQHFKSLKSWKGLTWVGHQSWIFRPGNGTTPDLSEVTCIHALLRQVSYSFNGFYGFNHLPFSRTDKKKKRK